MWDLGEQTFLGSRQPSLSHGPRQESIGLGWAGLGWSDAGCFMTPKPDASIQGPSPLAAAPSASPESGLLRACLPFPPCPEFARCAARLQPPCSGCCSSSRGLWALRAHLCSSFVSINTFLSDLELGFSYVVISLLMTGLQPSRPLGHLYL